MADMLSRAETARAFADAEADADGAGAPPALHPLRFLGMGLLIAWLCCTHINAIYIDASSPVRLPVETGMRLGDIGAFLAMALFARRIAALSAHRFAVSASVAVTACGTALIGLVLVPQGSPAAIVWAVAVATAVGGAVLFCLWAEVFCQMGTTSMVVYGGGSCIVAFLVYCLVSTMMQPYAIVATSLLPVCSLACAQASFALLPREAPHGAASYPVPWKLIVLMGIAGLMSGAAGALLGDASNLGAIHRIWVTCFAGGVLLYMALRRPSAFDIRFMTRVCFAASVVALAIMPLAPLGLAAAVSFLVKLAYVWFTVFAVALLANLAYRFDVPSLRLFALARACSEGGIFLGVLVREGVARSQVGLDATTLSLGAFIGLLLLGVCVGIWRSERAVNADWGAAGIEIESGERVVSPRERLIARCEQLAQEYGLTAREAEVLTLIAQRKTRAEMEQELFLSQNTVKTHVRHVYAKLGVHSKADVYDLAGEWPQAEAEPARFAGSQR